MSDINIKSNPRATIAKRIIPCLDVANGRVVKGINFVNLKDAGDPVEVAARYNEQGADEVAFLDITASHEGRGTLLHMVEAVAKRVFIPLTVGGGIGSIEDIRSLLNAGADKVSINSAAVRHPTLIQEAKEAFGSQCIVVAIDAKRVQTDLQSAMPTWHIYTHGGRKDTGLDAIEWAHQVFNLGAGELLVTSMDRDGTGIGFDCALTRAIAKRVNIPIIASGGVGALEHLAQGIIEGGADAVLAASIFHFGQHSIQEAKEYLAKRGVVVRL